MTTAAIEHFLRFCESANIDHRQGSDSLRKYLLAYQRNLNHKPAFDAIFANTFINWDHVQRSLPKLDCMHWILIFQMIDFSEVPCNRSILSSIERNLDSIGVDKALACQVFLLRNTNFVTAQVGVERLFAEHGVVDAYNQSLLYFGRSADEAFDLNEVTVVFCHIMKNCKVLHENLEKEIQFVSMKEKELIESFRVKQSRMVGGRPRLRSKLKEINTGADSVASMGKYDKWCQKVGFPAVFAKPMRDKLYFLMSQPTGKEHVHTITRDVHVCRALENAMVEEPDSDVLFRTITSMRLLEEPFRELFAFKNECLNSFPLSQLNEISLNELVHLYVCAYQRPQVWTEIWKQIVPFLSHQVIRDVEAFTSKYPFNLPAVMKIMNGP